MVLCWVLWTWQLVGGGAEHFYLRASVYLVSGCSNIYCYCLDGDLLPIYLSNRRRGRKTGSELLFVLIIHFALLLSLLALCDCRWSTFDTSLP